VKITKHIDKSVFRFALVGVVNTVVGLAIELCCLNILGFGFWGSTITNYTLTSILSYFLNKHFTFENKTKSIGQIFKFAANIVVCYLISHVIAESACRAILSWMEQGLRDNISMLVGMGLFTVTNYIGQRIVVFASKEKKQDSIGNECLPESETNKKEKKLNV